MVFMTITIYLKNAALQLQYLFLKIRLCRRRIVGSFCGNCCQFIDFIRFLKIGTLAPKPRAQGSSPCTPAT